MTKETRAGLDAKAREIRALTIDTIGFLGVGHIGGAMSIVDALALLYYRHMDIDPSEPRKRGRDQLVLSKGHAGPALYATLASRGFFPSSGCTPSMSAGPSCRATATETARPAST